MTTRTTKQSATKHKAKPAKKRVQVRASSSKGVRKATKRPRRGDAQKAAVMAALLVGCSVTEIAKQQRMPKSTVMNYKRELTPEQIALINTKRAGELDDMLWAHLRSNFEAMDAITTHVQSEKYIQRQDPDALAVLYGVINDKSVRILDAVERARGSSNTGSGEPESDRETT